MEHRKHARHFQRLSLLLGVLILLFSMKWLLWPQMLKVPVPDESTFLYEGWRVANGAVPYRDFFEFIGPGTLYWVAWHIKLFGMSLLALRLSVTFCVIGGLWLLWSIAKRFLRQDWCLLLCVFTLATYLPGGLVVQHHIYSALLGLIAVWALIKFIETKSATSRQDFWLYLAGFATGVCGLFTQSLGGLLGLSLAVFLWVYFRFQSQKGSLNALVSTALYFILPALFPVLGLMVFFKAQNALGDLTYDTFGWLMQGGYAKTTSHWYLLDAWTRIGSVIKSTIIHPSLLWKRPDVFLQAFWMLVQGFLPILGILWTLQVILDNWPHKNPYKQAFSDLQWQLLLITLSSGAYLAATLSYPNVVLVAYHGWLPYLLAFGALANIRKRYSLAGLIGTLVVLSLSFNQLVVTVLDAVQAYRTPGIVSYGTRETTLSPVNHSLQEVHAFNALLQFLHEQSPPGQSLFIYNGAPEFYLLTARENPTRYQMLMALYNTPSQIAEAVADLNRKKPSLIIYNQVDIMNFKRDQRFHKLRHYDFRLHALEALLQKHYQPAGQLGPLIIFRKTTTP